MTHPSFTRREFGLLAGGAGLSLLAGCGRDTGGEYPSQDISLIIPYGPGGGFDTFARAVAPALPKYLPRPVNVIPVNLPGGGGGKGMAQLYRERPDGYTLGMFPIPGAMILQQQQGSRDFDLTRFSWLGILGPSDNYAMAVGANSPVRSVADLQKLSATREVKFTATGPDGTSYLASVIGAQLLGIRPRFITGYAGSNDYIVATMRGDGDAVVAAVSSLRPFHDSGQMRIIASFEAESTIPGAPGARELGQPDLAQITIDRMVAAPPELPPAIRTVLTTAIDEAVRDPQVVAWAQSQRIPWTPHPSGAADTIFREQAAFFEKWKHAVPAI
jgi:tripartite-type tricarboxylate transporter receptor subunit TctC